MSAPAKVAVSNSNTRSDQPRFGKNLKFWHKHSLKLWQGKVSKTTRSLAGETGANRALLNRLFTRNKPASWGNTSPFGLYRLSCLWLFGNPLPFSIHSGLFIPVSSCRKILFLDFPERLLITWSWETLTDFEKKPALNSLTLKFFKWYFVFLIAGLFRNRFIFYTALVPSKVLPIFRQSGSFHMSLTITNFFQQWDFLCDCLPSTKPEKSFLT